MHLIDVTMFYARESGGVKRYLLAKNEWLHQHTRHRHTLVIPGPAVRDDEIATGGVPIPFSNGYRFPWRSQLIQRRLAQLDPDIIEAGDPYIMGRAALASGQTAGVPVVGFYHSDLPRMLGQRLGSGVERLATKYVKRFYREFDLVLAPSRIMVEQLRSMGIDRAQLQPLGVDTEIFTPQRRNGSLRAAHGLSADTRLLVFVGRFAREKNLPLLLQTMQRLGKPYHLFLIGSGAQIPPQDNVTVLPFQENAEQLASLVAGCDAFVHPGAQETFGLVALEAMAAGLPVVGIDAGGVAELIDDSVGILIPPGKATQFAEGVTALFERDLTVMGHAARHKVVSQYAWQNTFPRLLHRYEKLLSPHTMAARPGIQVFNVS